MNRTPQEICRLYRNILKVRLLQPTVKSSAWRPILHPNASVLLLQSRRVPAGYTLLTVEFHDHAKETDPKKIETYINDAEAGLGQIKQFTKEKRRGTVEYTIGK